MLPHVRLHMLGPWELSADGRSLPRPATQKTQSLLAYLVMNNKSAHHREKLATLFWPDADEENAQRSLRTALWSIRRLLGHGHDQLADALAASRADVRWAPSMSIEVDVERFEQTIREGARIRAVDPHGALVLWEAGAALYRGPLLEGLYDDWCLNERYRLEEQYISLLESLVGALEREGRFRDAVAFAQRVLTVDPLREDMHCVVIRLFGFLGDRSAAIRQYQRCKDVLQAELDVAPGPEVEAAFAASQRLDARAERLTSTPVQAAAETTATRRIAAGTQPARKAAREAPPVGRHDADVEPLVGREAHWHALTTWLTQVEAGSGHAALLIGEAGSGKTRLLEEIAARARWRNVRVLWGRCYEFERVIPYQPFAEALRNGLRGTGPTAIQGELEASSPNGQSRTDAEILASLPLVRRQALRLLLPDWAEHPQSESVSAPPILGDEQGQLLEAISDLLGALAVNQPLWLIIDDMQWAAASTLQLFHYLARTLPRRPIVLVGAYRPEDLTPPSLQHPSTDTPSLPAIQRSLTAEGRLDVLTLDPLDQSHVTDLVRRFLEMDRSSSGQETDQNVQTYGLELATRLHGYTGGNALYLIAALQTLRESGAFIRIGMEGGAALPNLDQGEDLPIPSRIRELLEQRLERASGPAREALRLAAVAGREFDLEVLEGVWGKGEEETLRAVDDLLAARFIKESESRGARDFAFTHHLLQESIYSGLARHIRTRTHRKVADVMEAVYGPRAVAAELAYHYEHGEVPMKAIRYAGEAGDQAAAGYANDDAIRWYSRALTQLSAERNAASPELRSTLDAQRFALVHARLTVLKRVGRPRDETADVEELASLARGLGDPRQTIAALLERVGLNTRAGRYEMADALAREAITRAEGLTGYPEPIRLALQARADECQADVYLVQDAYADAVSAYERALAGYRRLTTDGESSSEVRESARSGESGVLDQLGWLHERLGDYASARQFHEAALALCKARGDVRGEAAAVSHLGNVDWFTGHLEESQRRYASALDMHRHTGYRRGEGTSLRNLGLVLWRLGDLEQALDCHRRAMVIFDDLDDPEGILECHHAVGDVYFVMGRLEEALDNYLTSLELAQRTGSSHSLAQSRFGAARAVRALGRPAEALVQIEEARALCGAIGYPRGLSWCNREGGLAELDLGHAERAADLLQDAVDGFAALGEPSLLAATQAELALAALALGRLDEALTLADQAASEARAGGRGLDQPQAVYFTLYKVLVARGDNDGAEHALAAARAAVKSQADRFSSAALRESFLQDVPVNRAIGAAPLASVR